jgi:hypothetical protein
MCFSVSLFCVYSVGLRYRYLAGGRTHTKDRICDHGHGSNLGQTWVKPIISERIYQYLGISDNQAYGYVYNNNMDLHYRT